MIVEPVAIAPWFYLCLTSCSPGFESQAKPSTLSSIYIVKIETVIVVAMRKVNEKDAEIGPLKN